MTLGFTGKLALYLSPFAAALSLPVYTLCASGEILPPDWIAQRHVEGPRDAIYGAAYTGPTARYKLTSIALRDPELIVLGSSRTLEMRSDFFLRGEAAFYNAGLLAERLHELRRTLHHLPADGRTRSLLVGLDAWSFNPAWREVGDNPLFEGEIGDARGDVLHIVQHGLVVWKDAISGKLELHAVSSGAPHIGVMARVRGDGFRRDGSYRYHQRLTDPRSDKDWQFASTLARIERGVDRFVPGDTLDREALAELERFAAECRRRGLRVAVFLPPLAPSVADALARTGRHDYLREVPRAIEPGLRAHDIALFDFGSCDRLGCSDAEFIDGFHTGEKTDARMLAVMADALPWLDEMVDQAALRARIAAAPPGPALEAER